QTSSSRPGARWFPDPRRQVLWRSGMSVASGKTSPETPRQLFATLKDDIVSVTDDIKRRGVRRAMVGPFASLEAFYLTDEDRRRLAELHGFQRFRRRAWGLARGLLAD